MIILCWHRPEGAPGMETASKAMRFIAFAHQAQLPRMFCILRPHMLNVNLKIKLKRLNREGKSRIISECGCNITYPGEVMQKIEVDLPDKPLDSVWSPLGLSGYQPTCTPVKHTWAIKHNVYWNFTGPYCTTCKLNTHWSYLFSIVQEHDVIISQIILTKVRAFLRYRKVAFFIGASAVTCHKWEQCKQEIYKNVWNKMHSNFEPKKSGIFHVFCVFIIWFLWPNANPEEVFWFLTFIYYL